MSSLKTLRNWLAQKLGKSHNGNRDLYQVFGYSKNLTADDFYAMYLRNDIAHRLIRAYPQATWRDMPSVKSDNEAFTEEFQDLYEEHKLSNYLERADRLSQIGHFGLLFLGFKDGQDDLSQPLIPNGRDSIDAELAYVAPYGEHNVTITKWDANVNSERYGLPVEYTLQKGNPNLGKRSNVTTENVHHSRVIHIAERLDEDETYGVPMLMPGYNRLKDIEKIMGGAAETFWQTADRGLHVNADPEANLEDPDKLEDDVDEYIHNLRRVIATQGVDIDVLGSDVADPESNFMVQVKALSGTYQIPMRKLIGSEAGELASSQDETNFNSSVDERRMTFAAPMIVRPFIEKMQLTGNLPQVEGEIEIDWDEADALDEETIAKIQKARAETIDRLNRAIPNLPVKQLVKVFYPEKSEDEIEDIISEVNAQDPITQP